MWTLRSVKITITAADTIAIFHNIDDARTWIDNGATDAGIQRYSAVTLPAKKGTYLTTRWLPVPDRPYVAYIKEYHTFQHHTKVWFPYRAWVAILPENTI